jgi:hypothetical protein
MECDIEIFGEIFDRNKMAEHCLRRDCKLRDFKIRLPLEKLKQSIPNLDMIMYHQTIRTPSWDCTNEFDAGYELCSQLDKILPYIIEHEDNEYIKSTNYILYF